MRCRHCKRNVFYNFNIWRWTTGRPGRKGVVCTKHLMFEEDGTLMDRNLCHEPDMERAVKELADAA